MPRFQVEESLTAIVQTTSGQLALSNLISLLGNFQSLLDGFQLRHLEHLAASHC